jgi:hypothetical protein
MGVSDTGAMQENRVPDPDSPPAAVPWAARRKTFIASEALLRILHKAADSYGGDIDSFIVYLAITCACVSGAIRDPDRTAKAPPAGPMSPDMYRPVSRRAIAASTGLPRETVRRKVAQFLEAGTLVAVGSAGVRIREGLMEDPRNMEFAMTLMREFSRAAEDMDRIRC